MFPKLGAKVKIELADMFARTKWITFKTTPKGSIRVILKMHMPNSYEDILPRQLGFYKVNSRVVNSWMITDKEKITHFLKALRPLVDKLGYGPANGMYIDNVLKILTMPRCRERRDKMNTFRAHQKRWNLRRSGRPDQMRIALQQSRRARQLYEKTKEGQQALNADDGRVKTLGELLEHSAVQRLKEKYAEDEQEKPEKPKEYVTLSQSQAPPDEWEPEGD